MANPFAAFQMGAELGQGQSALGQMVRTIVERFGRQQELQGEMGLKFQGELALEREKSNLASERIKALLRGSQGGGQVGGEGRGPFIPTGFTQDGVTFEDPLAKAQGEASRGAIERTQKLSGALKRLAILNREFETALPSAGQTPFAQRIRGGLSSFGAITGLAPNAPLLALKKGGRPMAISIVRDLGEVGNLSESDITSAVDTVSQEGLTEEERKEFIQTFGSFVFAGIPGQVKQVALSDPDVRSVIDAFKITTDVAPSETSSQTGMGLTPAAQSLIDRYRGR